MRILDFLNLPLFVSILAAYLLGSIPTSFLFAKFIKGVDIRQQGSGNVGATNALRVLGKLPAAIVLLLDVLKGVIAVTVLPAYFFPLVLVTENIFKVILGLSCIVGHCWMIFLGFKGGKGVATGLGILLGLVRPWMSLVLIVGLGVVIWGVVVYRFRYVSLGSMVVSISIPILMLAFNQPMEYTFLAVTLCIIICYKHKPNIKRLLKGQEHRIGEKISA